MPFAENLVLRQGNGDCRRVIKKTMRNCKYEILNRN
jgi:hypothetical protein